MRWLRTLEASPLTGVKRRIKSGFHLRMKMFTGPRYQFACFYACHSRWQPIKIWYNLRTRKRVQLPVKKHQYCKKMFAASVTQQKLANLIGWRIYTSYLWKPWFVADYGYLYFSKLRMVSSFSRQACHEEIEQERKSAFEKAFCSFQFCTSKVQLCWIYISPYSCSTFCWSSQLLFLYFLQQFSVFITAICSV